MMGGLGLLSALLAFTLGSLADAKQVNTQYCQAPVQVHTIPYLKESQRISENL